MRSGLLVIGVVIHSMISPCFAQHEGWQPDYGAARAIAEKNELPVLLHFHAWYCGPCQRMERDVFPDPEVRQSLANGLTAVQIDVSHEPELASQFGASTVPRDVAVFPNGEVETLNIGYMSRASYLTLLRNTATRGASKRKVKTVPNEADRPVPVPLDPAISQPNVTSAQANVPNAVAPEVTPNETGPVEPLITGLEGYCPVRLHDAQQWTSGLESIVADYRDIRYRFASETDRAAFLKNPAEYAPQDLGCDPIVLTRDGKAVTGSIKYGAFFDQRLYLFQTQANREQFKLSPLKYIEIRSALKAHQIQGTRFQ